MAWTNLPDVSDPANRPAESMGSIVATALLHGSTIMLLLLAGTMMGWPAHLDDILGDWLASVMDEDFVHEVPAAILWLMAVLIAFGLPLLMLCCSHGWQRMTVWIASLAVLGLWAPVLCLASHRPEISMSCVAAAVAGLLVAIHLFRLARKQSPS